MLIVMWPTLVFIQHTFATIINHEIQLFQAFRPKRIRNKTHKLPVSLPKHHHDSTTIGYKTDANNRTVKRDVSTGSRIRKRTEK
ncbi:hypothetical protein NOF04DRAFT_1074595 [Fusarium oxysporum II5]|nr:hypothetical protein NOF04DRAFT_1074595 [Fusarium oxysporum II5]